MGDWREIAPSDEQRRVTGDFLLPRGRRTQPLPFSFRSRPGQGLRHPGRRTPLLRPMAHARAGRPWADPSPGGGHEGAPWNWGL